MTAALPIEPVRAASRQLVRELGFMNDALAGTAMPSSAVHSLIEIGARGTLTANELAGLLHLEKSSVSRMLRKLVEAGEITEEPAAEDRRIKQLTLTVKGRATLAGIHDFAKRQVTAALTTLRAEQRQVVVEGLELYAGALAGTHGAEPDEAVPYTIETGYCPGLIADCVGLHARYYAQSWGLGRAFEASVAAWLAEFCPRLERPGNQIWRAMQGGRVVGTIAIDGELMGDNIAQLRCFIVADGARGGGIGRELLGAAVDFCRQHGFREIRLRTFRGLDSARRLYEAQGFVLTQEEPGLEWDQPVMEQWFTRSMP